MITFKDLEMKNFLSVGEDPIVFHLNKSPTTIITGSNGVGKTSIVDGITFSLFGKSFRDIKKGSLINSINKKNSYTSITLSKGNTDYKITRGQKPHMLIVEVNGVVMHETAAITETQKYIENQILGFDFNTFTRVCVMSTMNYTPFMSLSSYERRNFVENMLDLKMFSEMNKLHKAETILLKDEIKDIDNNLSIIDSQINEKRNFIAYIKSNSDDDLKAHQETLQKNITEIADVENKIAELSGKETLLVKPLTDSREKLTNIQADIYKLNSNISVIKSKVTENDKTINYISNHDNCDLCKQQIDDKSSQQIISNLEQSNKTLEDSVEVTSKQLSNLYPLKSDTEAKINDYSGLANSVSQKINNLKQLKTLLERTSNTAQTHINKIQEKSLLNSDEVEREVAKLIHKHSVLKQQFEDKTEELKISNTVLELLKDTGIKADIIKQYIPMLCAYVNSYLAKLNISLTFNMDENFNESISTRYTNDFTYNNLSAGERSRVDLALSFAWRNVAKAKGSVHTNLLILDEVLDANLDDSGTAASLEIVNDISQDNTNIFIVSHKSNLEEHVRSVLALEKVQGFTRIK